MGFNYLQTDDRDDYFARFDRKKKASTTYVNLKIYKDGVLIIEGTAQDIKIRVKKMLGLTARFAKYGRWREEAIKRGYIIESETVKII